MTTTITPPRTPEQRLAALAVANERRLERASLKRSVKARPRLALEVIEQPSPAVATMKVYDLLMAVPRFGRVRAVRVLSRCRISTIKTLGGLSPRQREELGDVLAGEGVFRADPFLADATLARVG